MSSWRTGKISVECSIDIMQKILLGIVPEWESRIKVDPEGKLDVNNSIGKKKCHILIPAVAYGSSRNSQNANYSDIGFIQKNGKWEVIVKDFYGFNIESAVQKEFAVQTIKAAARKRKAKLITEEETPKGKRMVLFIPAN
jgi:predicted GIY-YIG superfamily endonuclease